MRWIFRYNESGAKYLGKLLHAKMLKPEPWMHIAVKTVSQRNPWSGFVIYVWDTRQVLQEYRSNDAARFTADMFKVNECGMSRAIDNREPLKGGRKDINEFFEFGKFDASHSKIFDETGQRRQFTELYKRRTDKLVPKPATEAGMLLKDMPDEQRLAKPIPAKHKLWRTGQYANQADRPFILEDCLVVGFTDKLWRYICRTTTKGETNFALKSKKTIVFNTPRPDLTTVADIKSAEADRQRKVQENWRKRQHELAIASEDPEEAMKARTK